jgi:hypothetical protein
MLDEAAAIAVKPIGQTQEAKGEADPVAAAEKLDWRPLGIMWRVHWSGGESWKFATLFGVLTMTDHGGVEVDAVRGSDVLSPRQPIGSTEALARRMLTLLAELTAAKHAPHDAARDWDVARAMVEQEAQAAPESSEIPTPEALRVERKEATEEIARLQAALDHERQRANEAIAQLHDAKETTKAIRVYERIGTRFCSLYNDSTNTTAVIETAHPIARYVGRSESVWGQYLEEGVGVLGVRHGLAPDPFANRGRRETHTPGQPVLRPAGPVKGRPYRKRESWQRSRLFAVLCVTGHNTRHYNIVCLPMRWRICGVGHSR